MKNLLKPALISSFALIVMGTTIAVASSNIAPGCKSTVDAQPVLSSAEITDKLTALGYTAIEEIEREGGCFEVEAKDAESREMELLVHAVTGEILKSEVDD